MRRMLLLACAAGLCGSVAVVAFAADAPIAERPSTPTPGVQLISRVAERLGIGRRTMWRVVGDVRRRISPREWSDARGDEGGR